MTNKNTHITGRYDFKQCRTRLESSAKGWGGPPRDIRLTGFHSPFLYWLGIRSTKKHFLIVCCVTSKMSYLRFFCVLHTMFPRLDAVNYFWKPTKLCPKAPSQADRTDQSPVPERQKHSLIVSSLFLIVTGRFHALWTVNPVCCLYCIFFLGKWLLCAIEKFSL